MRGAIAGKIRKPLHAHGVGEDQAFEPHLLTQQRVHDGRRQGGGLGFGAVQSRNVQVRNHDCPHAAFEGVGKRGELHAVQTCPVVGNGRKRGVRVAVAVAVPGEVLGCGQDMDVLKAVGVSLSHLAHERHVLPEASAPDHGVDGVGIHVDEGGQSSRARLWPEGFAPPLDQTFGPTLDCVSRPTSSPAERSGSNPAACPTPIRRLRPP